MYTYVLFCDLSNSEAKFKINTLSCLLLFNLNLFANETTYSNTRISLTTIIHVERDFCYCFFKWKIVSVLSFSNMKRQIDEHMLNCFCQFSFWSFLLQRKIEFSDFIAWDFWVEIVGLLMLSLNRRHSFCI